jgi:hypothetical protein
MGCARISGFHARFADASVMISMRRGAIESRFMTKRDPI